MPTYEYRCAEGHHFEQFQRMSEAPVDRCPQCGAAAERLLSPGAGLLFKGSGFYITDYRSDSYRKAAAAEGGASPSEKGTGGAAGGEKQSGGQGSTGSSADAAKPKGSGGSAPS